LISTPWREALPIAATTVTGVEMTRAQGQATSSSTSARLNHGTTGSPKSSGGMATSSTASSTTTGV
jgi:hypothetical protein